MPADASDEVTITVTFVVKMFRAEFEDWADLHGHANARETKQDIGNYLLNNVQQAPMIEERDGTVTLKGVR